MRLVEVSYRSQGLLSERLSIMSSTTKKLRACMLCSLVQTPSEFRRDGCPNCEPLGVGWAVVPASN